MQSLHLQDGHEIGVDLPILDNEVSPAHVFSPAELAQCADGKCCRCSRCCFLNAVPAIPVDIGQAFMPVAGDGRPKKWFASKGPGELCTQHSWNADGLSTCACHHQKGIAPILDACTEFQASELIYEDTRRMTRNRLFCPQSATDITVMKDWYWRGLLSDIEPAESSEEALDAVKNILSLANHFPSELMDAIGIRSKFIVLDSMLIEPLLKDIENICQPGVFEQFEQYILHGEV